MKINVVGLGKLGLPLAVLLSEKNSVTGIDLDSGTVKMLEDGVMPFFEPELEDRFSSAVLNFTDTFDGVGDSEATFIIVPTPSLADGSFSTAFLADAASRLGHALKGRINPHLVVVVSTVMPGDTETVVQKVLESSSGREVGSTLMLTYSPEFIALGEVFKGMEEPDMVLIGQSDERSGLLTQAILQSFLKNRPQIHKMSLIEAEITKIAVNTFVTTKISYANYLNELCTEVGASAAKVAAAVGADSRIGKKYFTPGTPFGGPCFPRDARAFATFSENLGISADIPLATAAINERQVDRMVDLVKKVLPPGGKVAILGLAYKPGTWVTEESAGRKLAEDLIDLGMNVVAFDPMATVEGIPSADSVREAAEDADVVVIATAWPEFRNFSLYSTSGYLVKWA